MTGTPTTKRDENAEYNALDRLISLIAKIEVEKYLEEINTLRSNVSENSNLRTI